MINYWRKNSTYGVVLRFFVPFGTDDKSREKRFEILEMAIENILRTELINIITILIPEDSSQLTLDDGRSFERIINMLNKDESKFSYFRKNLKKFRSHFDVIRVLENGKLNTGCISQGFVSQLKRNMSYTFALSPEYGDFFQEKIIQAFIKRTSLGARIVQLSLDRLHTDIDDGTTDNAFCLWHNRTAGSVGLFWRDFQELVSEDVPYAGGDALVTAFRIAENYPDAYLSYVPDLSNSGAEYISAFSEKRESFKSLRKKEFNLLALASVGGDREILKNSIMK